MANYRKVARQKAKKYGLDPNVFERQIRQESGFNPNARSPAGAIGIAQIMPATAKGWGVDPNNPKAALDAAAKNMAGYVKKYGSYRDALVAYNAGPGRVGGPLPAETQNYIKTILGASDPKPLKAPRSAAPKSYGDTTPSAPTDDARKALALSLIGFGNLGGASYGGEDPLTAALVQAVRGKRPPPAKPGRGASASPTGAVTRFDGKPVVSWVVPILKEARDTGLWKGTVTSGVRTKAQQMSAAKSYGLQHYPQGPLASNHVQGRKGAVDVSDPEGLKRALKKLKVKKLQSSMPEDPVHFSRTGY